MQHEYLVYIKTENYSGDYKIVLELFEDPIEHYFIITTQNDESFFCKQTSVIRKGVLSVGFKKIYVTDITVKIFKINTYNFEISDFENLPEATITIDADFTNKTVTAKVTSRNNSLGIVSQYMPLEEKIDTQTSFMGTITKQIHTITPKFKLAKIKLNADVLLGGKRSRRRRRTKSVLRFSRRHRKSRRRYT